VYLDKENIKRIKKDPVAQKQLYDLIYENLFHIPNRYKKTKYLAEEIFNDAMIKIFDSITKQDSIDNVLAWASKIIFNTTIDSLRKEIKLSERITYPEELPVAESSPFSSGRFISVYPDLGSKPTGSFFSLRNRWLFTQRDK